MSTYILTKNHLVLNGVLLSAVPLQHVTVNETATWQKLPLSWTGADGLAGAPVSGVIVCQPTAKIRVCGTVDDTPPGTTDGYEVDVGNQLPLGVEPHHRIWVRTA